MSELILKILVALSLLWVAFEACKISISLKISFIVTSWKEKQSDELFLLDFKNTSLFTTSSISSVTPIQQNLLLEYPPIYTSSSESSNKTSREESCREEMEEMWEITER